MYHNLHIIYLFRRTEQVLLGNIRLCFALARLQLDFSESLDFKESHEKVKKKLNAD